MNKDNNDLAKQYQLISEADFTLGPRAQGRDMDKLEAYNANHTQAPKLTTISQLEQIPVNSIIWYPEHSENLGTHLTKLSLLAYIKQIRKDFDKPVRINMAGNMVGLQDLAKDSDAGLSIASEQGRINAVLKRSKEASEVGLYSEMEEYSPNIITPALTISKDPDLGGDVRYNYTHDVAPIFVRALLSAGWRFYAVPYSGSLTDPDNIRRWWSIGD